MTYSKEEKEKIHENLDKIKLYLDCIRQDLRDSVTVDFGPMKTYANYSRELAYHITVSKDGISCRSGGLGFDFDDPFKSAFRATAYSQFDFAVALIQNWFTVKSTVNNAIKEQQRMFECINNFEI